MLYFHHGQCLNFERGCDFKAADAQISEALAKLKPEGSVEVLDVPPKFPRHNLVVHFSGLPQRQVRHDLQDGLVVARLE